MPHTIGELLSNTGIQALLGAAVLFMLKELGIKTWKKLVGTTAKFSETWDRELRRGPKAMQALYATWSLALPDSPLWYSDEKGKFVQVSHALCQVIGCTPDDLKDFGWESVVHPNDRDRVIRDWREAHNNRRTFSAEFRFQSGDRVTNVRAQSIPLLHDNILMGYVGSIEVRPPKPRNMSVEEVLTAVVTMTALAFSSIRHMFHIRS